MISEANGNIHSSWCNNEIQCAKVKKKELDLNESSSIQQIFLFFLVLPQFVHAFYSIKTFNSEGPKKIKIVFFFHQFFSYFLFVNWDIELNWIWNVSFEKVSSWNMWTVALEVNGPIKEWNEWSQHFNSIENEQWLQNGFSHRKEEKLDHHPFKESLRIKSCSLYGKFCDFCNILIHSIEDFAMKTIKMQIKTAKCVILNAL